MPIVSHNILPHLEYGTEAMNTYNDDKRAETGERGWMSKNGRGMLLLRLLYVDQLMGILKIVLYVIKVSMAKGSAWMHVA